MILVSESTFFNTFTFIISHIPVLVVGGGDIFSGFFDGAHINPVPLAGHVGKLVYVATGALRGD